MENQRPRIILPACIESRCAEVAIRDYPGLSEDLARAGVSVKVAAAITADAINCSAEGKADSLRLSRAGFTAMSRRLSKALEDVEALMRLDQNCQSREVELSRDDLEACARRMSALVKWTRDLGRKAPAKPRSESASSRLFDVISLMGYSLYLKGVRRGFRPLISNLLNAVAFPDEERLDPLYLSKKFSWPAFVDKSAYWLASKISSLPPTKKA